MSCVVLAVGLYTAAYAATSRRPLADPVFTADIIVNQERLPFYKRVAPAAAELPPYNWIDSRFGSEGAVEVGAVVQPDGTVSGTFFKGGNASETMKRTAMNAVKKWKFPVIAADGKPIKYATSTTIRFHREMPLSTSDRGDMSRSVTAWSEIE